MKLSTIIKKRIQSTARPGYSLIEIMLGMAIVAGILVGAIQMARAINDRMKVSANETQVRMLKSAIDQYKLDVGRYPQKIDDLINPPSDATERRRWQGPYATPEKGDSVFRNRYGNEVEYRLEGNAYEVLSFKTPGSDVSVISSNDV